MDCSARPHIGAVVLAAGQSRRMGAFKPLLPLGGATVLERVLATLAASRTIRSTIVVTGHEADRVRAAVEARGISSTHNPYFAQGEMISSIQAGLRALPGDVEAALVVLCDQPLVESETIATLASAWRARRPRVLLPRHAGRRGHPIVLGARGFGEILALPADAGSTLKTYTAAHAGCTIEIDVDDPGILLDLDTPADYQAALARLDDNDDDGAATRRRRSWSCPNSSEDTTTTPATAEDATAEERAAAGATRAPAAAV